MSAEPAFRDPSPIAVALDAPDLDPQGTHHFGSPSFRETQVTRVVDDTGSVRVLVIDPHRHAMKLAVEFASDRTCGHVHDPRPNRSNCAGSRRGTVRPR